MFCSASAHCWQPENIITNINPKASIKQYHLSPDLRQSKQLSMDEHFAEWQTKAERNCAIVNAFEDGYTQSLIAKYLGVTPGLVSIVIKKIKD